MAFAAISPFVRGGFAPKRKKFPLMGPLHCSEGSFIHPAQLPYVPHIRVQTR